MIHYRDESLENVQHKSMFANVTAMLELILVLFTTRLVLNPALNFLLA